jgi:hypothetical protein
MDEGWYLRRDTTYAGLRERDSDMELILWLLAVVLVVWGIVTLVRGQVLMGVLLIIVGLLVGPGGVSVFT